MEEAKKELSLKIMLPREANSKEFRYFNDFPFLCEDFVQRIEEELKSRNLEASRNYILNIIRRLSFERIFTKKNYITFGDVLHLVQKANENKKHFIIKVSDKVITKDGFVGRVDTENVIRYNDGKTFRIISEEDYENGFSDFYLIGKNFFGNKISPDEIESRIAEQREVVRTETEKLDALRKQLWTLNERMVPDWREREEERRKQNAEQKAARLAREATEQTEQNG